ncbi:hypothetical protein PCASD_10141 [Puccinia coronata f. sp. avenae]|uniref:Uncharacterized protein n=1 Tax=Puccinia coronata f. sp. avenae TaxID=200324 RepID=A0A2N5T592_9BASI|nr:hypothetical protein PCASD_17104 [Puccinia coronata f. sp. avenae]PLW41212.1 hypothetical protein PCASD_10141 [Puccinia coronata f. sp. avenae]
MSVQRTPPHHPANTTTSRSAEDCPTESPKNTAIPNNPSPKSKFHQLGTLRQ